ncbi:MAG: hypothetical protein KDD94_11665 [Calditrichaeota bacterium]|nr:hypothetical protein [Calditrichota bacterium]
MKNQLLIILFLAMSSLASQNILIICNKKLNLDNLSINQVKDIFKGDQHQINGRNIDLSYLSDEPYTEFFTAIFGRRMTSSKIARYWLKKSFRAYRRPKIFKTCGDLLDFLNSDSNSISYIEEKVFDTLKDRFENITTVKINQKESSDLGYFFAFKKAKAD